MAIFTPYGYPPSTTKEGSVLSQSKFSLKKLLLKGKLRKSISTHQYLSTLMDLKYRQPIKASILKVYFST